MKIDITGEKIVIVLCNKSFGNYKILTGMPQMLPVLHSMLIVPTLIYTFEKLKSEGTSEFEDLRWYKSIERTLRKQGLTLDAELLDALEGLGKVLSTEDVFAQEHFGTDDAHAEQVR